MHWTEGEALKRKESLSTDSYLDEGSPGSPRAAAAAANCCCCCWCCAELELDALAKCCRKGNAAEYPFAASIAAAAAALSLTSLFPPLLLPWCFMSGPRRLDKTRVQFLNVKSFLSQCQRLTFSSKICFISKPWFLGWRKSKVWDNISLSGNCCCQSCWDRAHHTCHWTSLGRTTRTTVFQDKSCIKVVKWEME